MHVQVREAEVAAELGGEPVVLDLDLLQAEDVRADLGDDPAEGGLPQADRVGVPGGEAEGHGGRLKKRNRHVQHLPDPPLPRRDSTKPGRRQHISSPGNGT